MLREFQQVAPVCLFTISRVAKFTKFTFTKCRRRRRQRILMPYRILVLLHWGSQLVQK